MVRIIRDYVFNESFAPYNETTPAPCYLCNDEREIECSICSGTGYFEGDVCLNCDGRKYIECPECNK